MCFLQRTVTAASLGYSRSTVLVEGTTCTRLRYLFEASLLTITAGRCFRISPPTEAAKLRDSIRAGGEGLGLRVLHALEKTQSVAYAKRRAEEFARLAKQELECLPRSECRTILETVAEWSVRREK